MIPQQNNEQLTAAKPIVPPFLKNNELFPVNKTQNNRYGDGFLVLSDLGIDTNSNNKKLATKTVEELENQLTRRRQYNTELENQHSISNEFNKKSDYNIIKSPTLRYMSNDYTSIQAQGSKRIPNYSKKLKTEEKINRKGQVSKYNNYMLTKNDSTKVNTSMRIEKTIKSNFERNKTPAEDNLNLQSNTRTHVQQKDKYASKTFESNDLHKHSPIKNNNKQDNLLQKDWIVKLTDNIKRHVS